ncbi:MAG: response regulator [Bryobacterales bacterium]|nr:response regulator [Bryobacterales bacterium]
MPANSHFAKNAPERALLCGLEHDVAQELKAALRGQDVAAELCADVDKALKLVDQARADVVFCGFTSALAALVDATSAKSRKIPVVVVSRHPEVNQWLDALEAGAADYCAAPFEGTQLRWILQAASSAEIAA